jgi:hypothetical protein
VFAGDAYNRSARQTIIGYLWEMFTRAFGRLVSAVDASPGARQLIIWGGFGIIALIVARAIYVVIQERRLEASRGDDAGSRHGPGESAWTEAQRSAASGDYTQAAHWLYAALLQSLAQRERVRLHSSKTAGDYARDLRSRSSPAWSPFRKFVKAFEFVAYGRRECSREEFEQLRALAAPVMEVQR